MARKSFGQQIGEFENALEQVTAAIPRDAMFERMPPEELWSKAEAPVTHLKSLVESFKAYLLILKPEKAPTIEQLFEAMTQPLNAFEEALFQKSTDPMANTKAALEQLRKAIVGGYDFLILAKEIRKAPSPAIKEILRLKEVYGAKDYISSIQVPETLQMRLISLIKRVDALSTSLTNLEKALNSVKRNLHDLQEESQKFRSAPVETYAQKPPETETEGQSSS